jgi:hypothetical protein
MSEDQKAAQWRARRASVEGWFGKTTDDAWKKLLDTPMLAQPDAISANGKFPLLIGMLRPLSTSLVCEMLASNGYVVAMVKSNSLGSFAKAPLEQIPDMQMAISYLEKKSLADASKIGVFGFSGSGFTPVLFGMYDARVKALADIESGLYMEGLFQGLSESNFYNPSKLYAPFLHIFSRDLSKQEKYLEELENKTKFSSRYRLLLNQPGLHHWDFASEGYTSCVVLKNRGPAQLGIQKAFEISSVYLLNFFDAVLKADPEAVAFMTNKPLLPKISSSAWDIHTLNPARRAPDSEEFEHIVRTKGIKIAIGIVNNTIKEDSLSTLWQGFALNRMGFTFLGEKKFEEAIQIFKLNTELHPEEANFFDSLAEGYETSGDNTGMKQTAQRVLDLLSVKTALTDAENTLIGNAKKRLK